MLRLVDQSALLNPRWTDGKKCLKDTPYRQTKFLRRCPIDIDRMTLWFVTAEDLLLSKLAWAAESQSQMQLDDVRNLITAVASLDWAYIEHWTAELQVAELLREVRE